MKKQQLYAAIITGTVATLIITFTYTGITKLIDHHSFESALNQSPLSKETAAPLSWSVPIVELIAVILLFFPATKQKGLWMSVILMGIFTTYIAGMLAINEKLPCSCGGIVEEMNWTQHLLFNVGVTALTATSIYLNKKVERFIAINRHSRIPV